MEFLQINSAKDFRAKEIYSAYCHSFPEDERRSESQFTQLFNNECAKIFAILNDCENIGYCIGWQLSHFLFLEHFEIFPQYRNQNLGSAVLNELYHRYSKIVLESEPETLDEIAARRIKFYRKNGFEIIDENYIQPAYSVEKKPLNLYLLSNFPVENLNEIRDEIHDVVYC